MVTENVVGMLDSKQDRDKCDPKFPEMSRIGVVIPTFNAEPGWRALRHGIDLQGLDSNQILVIDSSSRDRTRQLAHQAGYRVLCIEQAEFSHGGTRQLAGDILASANIVVYLTQDAILADSGAVRRLCKVFADPAIGAAYGRQLPREQAGAIERHARLFNYPPQSSVRGLDDRTRIGIKAAFLSNSFAAYRRTALQDVGGFPRNVIIAEDSVVAARLLMAGWRVAYVAEAAVVHSHSMTLRQEFSRYFDTGVHHAREQWLLESFGTAGEEGKRFLRSEFTYLFSTHTHLIPVAALRTLNKLIAYQLGLRESHLAVSIKAHLSAQPSFWKSDRIARQAMNQTTKTPVHTTR